MQIVISMDINFDNDKISSIDFMNLPKTLIIIIKI